MSSTLVFFHCGSNAGFAISRLERVFFDVARKVSGNGQPVHFAYSCLDKGNPTSLSHQEELKTLRIDPRDESASSLRSIRDYVRYHSIRWALGFDQPPLRRTYAALRDGGVERIVSYWGAPMSSINRGPRLWLKRLQVALDVQGPDLYVFESEAMRATATHGRGIPKRRTAVVHLGVDTDSFRPPTSPFDHYAHRELGIPTGRRIIYYSGHMEPRKGVHVIMRAAVELAARKAIKDVHFVLCGNRDGDEAPLLSIVEGTPARDHISFAGYRADVNLLMRSASIGTIASTGWDSFTMSAVELAASGVPLIVSNLQGLAETVVPGKTGLTFTPGDHIELADKLLLLLGDPARLAKMGSASRERALQLFSLDSQVMGLTTALRGHPTEID